MNLKSLMESLAYTELSGLFMATNPPGTIDEESFPRILSAINSALTDLYTRFVLLEKELHILCFAHKTIYELKPQHATMDPTPALKYILDTPDYPFTGDLIRILSVTDEIGNTISFNDRGKKGSIYIPKYNTIQVNNPANDKLLSVMYQARHPKLVMEDPDDIYFDRDNQFIDIPPALEEALKVRVAFHVFSSMERKDGAAQVLNLASRYEMLCTQADHKNLLNDSSISTTFKLEKRGFI